MPTKMSTYEGLVGRGVVHKPSPVCAVVGVWCELHGAPCLVYVMCPRHANNVKSLITLDGHMVIMTAQSHVDAHCGNHLCSHRCLYTTCDCMWGHNPLARLFCTHTHSCVASPCTLWHSPLYMGTCVSMLMQGVISVSSCEGWPGGVVVCVAALLLRL